jgi:hypothetical protein
MLQVTRTDFNWLAERCESIGIVDDFLTLRFRTESGGKIHTISINLMGSDPAWSRIREIVQRAADRIIEKASAKTD